MREAETARIESVTHDGKGIAAVSGKKVFVAGALEGEEVSFRRRKRRRNFDEAELLEVLSASPRRIEPRCAVFELCGGCSLQHIGDAAIDLPVLHYRALRNHVQAPRYWEMGDGDREFRFNNYLNRFHWRHLDLMDAISGFQGRGRASLDHAAVLLGFPGKLGMSGDMVWQTWLDGGIDDIRNYCETDVLNTYLIYLRFEFMRGNLDEKDLERDSAGPVGRIPRRSRKRDRANIDRYHRKTAARDPLRPNPCHRGSIS